MPKPKGNVIDLLKKSTYRLGMKTKAINEISSRRLAVLAIGALGAITIFATSIAEAATSKIVGHRPFTN